MNSWLKIIIQVNLLFLTSSITIGCAQLSQSGVTVTGASELLRVSFYGSQTGFYTAAMMQQDFPRASAWNNGLDERRAVIVKGKGNKFLRVTYVGKEFGPARGGVQFKVPFNNSYNELYFSYRVRFAKDFDFVKGGKLPGLMGGTGPTGCVSDKNGFSARNMWRVDGDAVQYLYAPRKISACGDDYHYTKGGVNQHFIPGEWQRVEHRLVMNTPGENNGIMQAWLDGELVLDVKDFLFREAGSNFAIDTLYFSTFFGGGDAEWAPQTSQITDFDDLVVSEKPIGRRN